MSEADGQEEVSHMISPSSWNRFETCPRMYWLSRQRLPRKAGMAASLGAAVHASVEDLLQEDYSKIGNSQDGWLPNEGERLLHGKKKKQFFMRRRADHSGRKTNGKKPLIIKKAQLGCYSNMLALWGLTRIR